jgi:hypothetical protein
MAFELSNSIVGCPAFNDGAKITMPLIPLGVDLIEGKVSDIKHSRLL